MVGEVAAGPGIAGRGAGHRSPVVPPEQHRVTGLAAVGGAAQDIRPGRRAGPGGVEQRGAPDGFRGDPGQVHQVHERGVGGGQQFGQRVQAPSQGGAHPLVPVVRDDGADVRGQAVGAQRGLDLGRAGAQHDRHRVAAAGVEHADRAQGQPLAVEPDQRLRPAHPAAGAAGQQQAGNRGCRVPVDGGAANG